MIFFLLLGIVLGGVSVLFIFENSMLITVSFLSWHITGSLSLVLFAAVMSGVAIALLVLLPSFIQDEARMSVLQKQKKELETELAEKNRLLAERPPVAVVHSQVL